MSKKFIHTGKVELEINGKKDIYNEYIDPQSLLLTKTSNESLTPLTSDDNKEYFTNQKPKTDLMRVIRVESEGKDD